MVGTLIISAMLLGSPPTEREYYRIVDVEIPESIVMEVGGLLALGDGRIMACTRRGEVWIINDAYGDEPSLTLYADGLQEPLGLMEHDGWIYTAQRGELTRMKDTDGDDRGDVFETVCDDWAISGNYHEYTFGPAMDTNGDFWITLNRPFGAQPFGKKDWRGWAMRVTPEGEMFPEAAGLRSPAGVAISPDGDVFYSDNQGEWCGTSKLSHIERGDFHGHPLGIDSAHREESLVEHPGEIPDGELMPEANRRIPGFKLPAVWFPYDKMGKSPAGFVWDRTGGAFGPFQGQVFIGDQHHAWVMRVYLEKVDGAWQGACFPFMSGFQSGIVRVAWGEDDSLIVGMTNRGWASRGNRQWGIQRLEWTGQTPFEIQRMEAIPGGFRLSFTHEVDAETARDSKNWTINSYTYRHHSPYGSPEVDVKEGLVIESITVSEDRRQVDLSVNGLREGYVHELHGDGVRDLSGHPLLHDRAYYTLNRIPQKSPD